MATTVAEVSVHEYLRTSYRPDCDYVDGVVEERNLGHRDHALIQSQLPIWFWARRKSLRLHAVTEWRVCVAKGRYRIPDVCVVRLPVPGETVLTSPPCIAIEIISPEDTLSRLQQRLGDYLEMGVPNIWVIDPASRRGWRARLWKGCLSPGTASCGLRIWRSKCRSPISDVTRSSRYGPDARRSESGITYALSVHAASAIPRSPW